MQLPKRQVEDVLMFALRALLEPDVIDRAKFKAAFEDLVSNPTGRQGKEYYAAGDLVALIAKQTKKKTPAKK